MARSPVQASVRKHLTAVRRSLRALDRVLAAFAVAMRTYRHAAVAPTKAVTRGRRTLTPKARAALKLQGQYMGTVRRLNPAQKALVRAVKMKSGTKAAITKAQELAGKRAA